MPCGDLFGCLVLTLPFFTTDVSTIVTTVEIFEEFGLFFSTKVSTVENTVVIFG